MGELRKDYILDRWVVYSVGRGARPHEFQESHVIVPEKTCFFCPGNEELTPAEIGRVGTKDKWQIRWFSNKFPALEPKEPAEPRTDNKFYTFANNYGYHEIITETPEHSKQLSELSVKEIKDVLEVYRSRIEELSKKPNIKYVNVIKNHGYHAGTSLVHSHSQVFATAVVPPAVREKISAVRKFVSCPYCAVVEAEKNSERKCFENSDWLAFCPYASRYNYEIWVFPKKHIRNLGEVKDLMPLAEIMQKVLSRLGKSNISYNYYVTYSPSGEDLHFHIEIMPQIAIYGGFERGSGAIINSVLPECAAEFYRGEGK
jgi:UDPglucose--hexose-1-phosphate uridylyltransferase